MTSFGVATRLPLSFELQLAQSLGAGGDIGVTTALTLRYTRNPPEGDRGAEGVGFRVTTSGSGGRETEGDESREGD